MDALDISQATLVGNSMGGWLAMLAAQDASHRVKNIVLVAPAFYRGLPPGIDANTLANAARPTNPEQMQAYFSRIFAAHSFDADDIQAALDAFSTANQGDAIDL